MKLANAPRILIVGAGSMGIATGYHLSLAGAEVTYLVRQHRLDALSRPQVLYSYDDHRLATFDGYRLVCDPDTLAPGDFDFIVITLDGAALRAPAGEAVTGSIGRMARGTSTGVILGTIGTRLRPWFLHVSGLAESQVTNGALGIQCYGVAEVTLPLHAPTDPALLAKADLAYRHCWPFGFLVDDTAPATADAFASVYNACGVSTCIIQPAEAMAAATAPFFAQMAAYDLAGWPSPDGMAAERELWGLAVAAVKEIQGLSIHGEAGRRASEQTTAQGLLDAWRQWEKDMRPLDLIAFNRYHHGGKVNAQDLGILADCIAQGDIDQRAMPATRELLAREIASKRG